MSVELRLVNGQWIASMDQPLPAIDRDEMIEPNIDDVVAQWSGLCNLVDVEIITIGVHPEISYDDGFIGRSDHRVTLTVSSHGASLPVLASRVAALGTLWSELRDGNLAHAAERYATRVYAENWNSAENPHPAGRQGHDSDSLQVSDDLTP